MPSLFQGEINLLRDTAKEYARRRPKLARYFGEGSTDSDVEHLLEGFAFLTSRLREKIEDPLPEITDAVIEGIWPNFLRPFPPATMLKFTPLEKAITQRQVIRRGARVLSPLQQEAACLFRTTADSTIYPLEIADVRAERTRDRSVIAVSFTTLSGLSLSNIQLGALRLNFCGAPYIRQMLYLWMCRHLKRLEFRPRSKERGYSVPLPQVTPAALGMAETLLDGGDPAFDGYRLLQEFFCMPDKFYAIDLAGLDLFAGGASDQEFSLIFEFGQPLPVDVKPATEHIQQ